MEALPRFYNTKSINNTEPRELRALQRSINEARFYNTKSINNTEPRELRALQRSINGGLRPGVWSKVVDRVEDIFCRADA